LQFTLCIYYFRRNLSHYIIYVLHKPSTNPIFRFLKIFHNLHSIIIVKYDRLSSYIIVQCRLWLLQYNKIDKLSFSDNSEYCNTLLDIFKRIFFWKCWASKLRFQWMFLNYKTLSIATYIYPNNWRCFDTSSTKLIIYNSYTYSNNVFKW